jgi:serine/threonine-protein kinase RsbW
MSPECAQGCLRHPSVLSFEIPADLERVPAIIEAIMELAQKEYAAGSDIPETLALVMQEAIANAIVHGSKEDASKLVHCEVTHAPDGYWFIVRDSGPGFNYRTPPDPLAEVGLGLDHGRGTFLIKELMDDVHYARNGAEIHMLKRK